MSDAVATYSLWRRLRHTRLRDVLRGRLDGSLDWRQSIELADLPPEIAAAFDEHAFNPAVASAATLLWSWEAMKIGGHHSPLRIWLTRPSIHLAWPAWRSVARFDVPCTLWQSVHFIAPSGTR